MTSDAVPQAICESHSPLEPAMKQRRKKLNVPAQEDGSDSLDDF